MQVSIYRYDPDRDEVPAMREMSIDLPDGKDLMVLDVLEIIKGQDPSLSYRRSCREGVCGSDGINMNGRNGLACMTPVSQVAKLLSIGAFLFFGSTCLLSRRMMTEFDRYGLAR